MKPLSCILLVDLKPFGNLRLAEFTKRHLLGVWRDTD